MKRIVKKIPVANLSEFSNQLIEWAQSFETFLWLDSNEYPQKYSSFDKALAIGVLSELKTDFNNAFEKLDQYQQSTRDYIFGVLSYDLKNDTENLSSNNLDNLNFPDLYFFQPKKLLFIAEGFVEFHYDSSCHHEIEADLQNIQSITLENDTSANAVQIKSRVSKQDYLAQIENIQQHIVRGDSYEVNFCMEYFAENAQIHPSTTYKDLNKISKPPFACFFKHENLFLMSASPERFVRKEGQKIISQPIKGTIKKGINENEDAILIKQLANDPKERAENIMIVDLVRNDLSKTATKESVKVEELCVVYSFKQVHQLISTVVSKVKKTEHPVAIVKALFPMGSMTGAPKIATMKIIEDLEESRRGIYSGSVGYFTPNGDFDFNVVIRSVLYNSKSAYVSFSVGGAITAKSIPEAEYEECLLKAEAMKKTLDSNF